MKKNKIITTFLLLFFQIILFAQTKSQEFNTFKAKYNSEEFNYIEKEKPLPKEYQPNEFSEFIGKIFNVILRLPLEIIFYCLLALFLAFIAYRIYKNGGVFKSNSKKIYNESDFGFIEENLSEINLNDLIVKAENEQNYPLAIRYLHYQNLQNLDKKGLIEWNPKKTNQQFINQIKQENIQTSFANNTKVFNQIWFGEFRIDATQYQTFKAMFNQLNQSIK